MRPWLNRQAKFWAISTAFVVLLVAITIFLQVLNSPLFFPPAKPTPTEYITLPVTGPTPIPNPILLGMEQIDRQIQEASKSSIAYNMPSQMELGQTITIELLLNPSISGEALATQLAQGADLFMPVTSPEEMVDVVVSDVLIQDLMRAELRSVSPAAFEIHPSHENGIQPISSIDTTKWRWSITAREPGQQGLELALYRLIEYHGEEYWREVETYRRTVVVEVTFLQKLQSLDWKSTLSIFITALIIPLFFRWYDSRKKPDTEQNRQRQTRKKQRTN